MIRQFKNENNYIVVLDRGDELISSLILFAKQNGLENLWLQSGLGASMDASLGRYDLETKSYIWRHYDDMHEIAQLSGNMTVTNGEPIWHIHAVLGGKDLTAIAGHVKDLTVGLTCELYLTTLETPMRRIADEETGLNLLGR